MMFDPKLIKKDKKLAETLYDPLKDDRCEEWTRKNIYLEETYSKPLSCAGCFTPVCYNYQPNV